MNNEEIKVQSDQGYYLGVKLIKARKAWRINGSAIVYDMNRMVQHDDVVDEGYEVEYPDGYKSFSPKDVFEKAYYMILSPNKIQEGDVLNFIKEGYSLRLGEKTTVVCDTTLTGFDTVGIVACVDPSTYDHDMGCGVARRDIKDKIWGHLGFVLQWAINGLKR
jgi:RNase P/RNase MRP subunit POP5